MSPRIDSVRDAETPLMSSVAPLDLLQEPDCSRCAPAEFRACPMEWFPWKCPPMCGAFAQKIKVVSVNCILSASTPECGTGELVRRFEIGCRIGRRLFGSCPSRKHSCGSTLLGVTVAQTHLVYIYFPSCARRAHNRSDCTGQSLES